jgi:hypothetical protein
VAKKARKKGKTRKAAPRSAKKATRAAKSAAAKKGQIKLKDIRKELERALAHVRRAPAKDVAAVQAGMDTATILTRMMSEIDDICASGDCGPDMVFPPPPPNAISRS